MSSKIHSTAIVDSNAEIASGVEIGPYAVIGPHVTIGEGCKIGPHVVIEGRTTLGVENTIFQFASIGSPPQDLKFKGEDSTLEIGSSNHIREYVTINPGTATGLMRTTVGDGNLFMMSSHVGHDCRIGSRNVFANSVALAGHVSIGSFVILGGMVGVHQFTRIGDYAIVGGGSMARYDIPPYCIGEGNRAHLRGINVVGLKRANISSEDISFIRKAYRHLFSTRGHLQEKIETLPSEIADQAMIHALIEFISDTNQGISTPLKQLGE